MGLKIQLKLKFIYLSINMNNDININIQYVIYYIINNVIKITINLIGSQPDLSVIKFLEKPIFQHVKCFFYFIT